MGKSPFAKKPAAICGASPGAIGTACSQNGLKPILHYLDVALMGQLELYLHFTEGLIDDEGNVTSEHTKKFLQKFVDAFAAWLDQHIKR